MGTGRTRRDGFLGGRSARERGVNLRGAFSRLSLERKLPLVISGLLLLAMTALSVMAYLAVRQSAQRTAADGLQRSVAQVVELLRTPVLKIAGLAQTMADDPALREFLVSPNARSRASALDALRYRGPQPEDIVAVELWGKAGQRELAVGPSAAAVAATSEKGLRPIDESDSARIGPLYALGGSVVYRVVAPVTEGSRHLGSVVQWRRLSLTIRLIGSSFFLGNKRGGLWTDLKGVVPAPPVDPALLSGVVEYEEPGGGRQIAAVAAVSGTPWLGLVEMPYRSVLEPAHRFLRGLALMALALFLFGLGIAWVLSRRITEPIGRLTTASESMASGDYSIQVRVDREDELGRLALAFNKMGQALSAKLQQGEESLARVLDTAQEAFVAIDAAGRIVDWNPLAEKTFGWSRQEVMGRLLTETIIPERYREPHSRGLARFLETGDGPVLNRRFEITALHREGREFPVELLIWPQRWKDGYLFSALLHDITERKRAEQSMAEKNVQLEVANRELEAFSYSVSHDLRAPLRSIDGFSRLLQEDYEGKLGAAGEDALRRIRAATQRMGDLIDDLLGLARVSRAELGRTTVDLSELARDLMKDFRRGEPHVEVIVAGGASADGDPRLLRIALENLIGNAFKFASKKADPRVEFGWRQDGARTVYFVRDNGAGFEMAYAAKLFGAFQRLHAADEFPGTGIGLATVQRIIHRHGGSVWAEGTVGEGATFSFTL
jgi:PAS domain S-box-containing protein